MASSQQSRQKEKQTTDPKILRVVKESIEVPREVLALNLGKVVEKGEIPELISQWDQEYAFQMVSFNISFVTSRGRECERGIKKVKIDGEFTKAEVSVMDVLPRTEWIAQNYSADASFSFDPLAVIGKIVVPPDGVTANLNFRYNWNPKAARMISGGAKCGVHWYSENAESKYLDGNYQISVMFSHPKSEAGPFRLKLSLFVHHDIAGGGDQYVEIDRNIEIRVKA